MNASERESRDTENSKKRERRDWTLFLLLLLLGVCLMLVSGQFAIALVSNWNVNADMHSELDPNQNYSSYQQVGVYAPLRPEILTPPPWGSTFLTPQPGIGLTLYPNFIFSPSQTPSGPTPVVSPVVDVPSTPPGMSTSTSAPNSTGTPIVIIIGSTSTQVPAPTKPPKPPSDTATPIPSVPEIVVEGLGAVNIADGGTYDLGSTTIFTPLTRTITVRNTGTATLNLLTNPPTVTGNFAATNFGSTSLAAGASTTFNLTCNATGLGSPVSGTVSFGNNDSDENPFDFTVTCAVTILPAPEIVVEGPVSGNITDGGTYDLGTTTLSTPLTRTITVRNTGTATLTLTNPPTVTGAFTATNFGSTSLAAGASTTFDLTCSATATGAPVSGTISFGNNDSDENPFDFTVTCTVTAPEIVVEGPPGATNIADGGTYDLGTTTLGTPLTRTITVRNTGTATLNLLTDPPTVTAGFAATTYPVGTTTLAPGASTTFDLTCNPAAPGAPVSGTVSFNNNDSDEAPFNFTVTCTVNAPEIVVEGPPGATNIADGGTYDLGTTTLGTPLTRTITVRNTGTATLNLLTAPPTVTAGFAATTFPVGTTTLAPGASTTFDLTCNPAAPGAPVSGTVSFNNNDSNENPFNFDVTCTVTAPEIVVEDPGSGNIADGGTYDLGTTTFGASITQTITVRNTGTATLNLTNPTVTGNQPTAMGNFAVGTFGVTSLAAGDSTAFSLTCNASSVGSPVSGTITFSNNDSNENPFNFTITCTVTALPPIPHPGQINFGPPDGSFYILPDGNSVTYSLSTPIKNHGDSNFDFVYYERAAGTGIQMDFVILEISTDGSTWIPVFYWGNGVADTNSNLNINALGGSESDNRLIDVSDLINSTGVGVDIDSLGLTGSYSYLRIISPGGGGDGCDIDAIEIY